MSGRLPDHIVDEARRFPVLEVARRFGAKLRQSGDEHIGPCPACGGHDRFGINTRKNVFSCRAAGQGGDAIALWQYLSGENFSDAVCALTGFDPSADLTDHARKQVSSQPVSAHGAAVASAAPAAVRPQDADGDNPFRAKQMREAYDLWRRAARQGPMVKVYLEARGLGALPWQPKALREVDALAYWHRPKLEDVLMHPSESVRSEWLSYDGESARSRIIHTGPAMLGAITGADGRFIGVHRTWLNAGGHGKATIACPITGEVLASKKVQGSAKGGKIDLSVSDDQRCSNDDFGAALTVVGEGIETALSWPLLNACLRARIWAGVSIGNMAGPAEGSVNHPTDTFVDKRGCTRRRRVPSGVPRDNANDQALVVPGDSGGVVFLGDGDSDYFFTRLAMRRAVARAGEGRARAEFAPDGLDWNDVLRGHDQGGVAA
ncbi:MAG: CHC2 zinc finger domain-containing protein [Pseudomonadota bacterium]